LAARTTVSGEGYRTSRAKRREFGGESLLDEFPISEIKERGAPHAHHGFGARTDRTEILLAEHDHAAAAGDGSVHVDDAIAAQFDAISGEVSSGELGRLPGHPIDREEGEIVLLIYRDGIRAGGCRRGFDDLVRQRIEIGQHRLLGRQGGGVKPR
jgi:hypothetical protein